MSLSEKLQKFVSEIRGTTLNRYYLDIPTCGSPLDVEDFFGSEGMSTLYRYDIIFNSPDQDISPAQMIGHPGTLTMGTGPLFGLTGLKVVHGVVTNFRRVSKSRDQYTWQITLEPFLSLLGKQFRSHRFFINKSVPDVVKQVLGEHGLKDWEYEFILKGEYPKREQINQYQESDLAFIQRLLAEVGIFYFFTLQPDTQTEVLHMADEQSAWQFNKTLPLTEPSGTSDNGADSVWDINVEHKVVPASVTAGDYNHRDANKILLTPAASIIHGDQGLPTYGDVYHYRARHLSAGDKLSPAAETGNFWARLEHERYLSSQTAIRGKSSDSTLSPAQVLTISGGSLPASLEDGMVIVHAHYTASRKDALLVAWQAVPYSETCCWRPAAKPRPVISGTLMARVTSAKAHDSYAHLNQSGLYWVKFDADRDDKEQGYESMPVRLARAYGGDTYGMHFPLIQGTEVAIAFHEGDPDRPYIAHALHNSRHPDHVTSDNNTRNVIRTAGLNKLRMEDKRGEEHIKLSTEYGGKTQLNLGHNVDAGRALRGEGAELRTDDWLSLRGGKGVFISADSQPKAQGLMLEMNAAVAQLQSALKLVASLAESASVSGVLDADTASQQQLSAMLEQLKGAGLLATAPAGVGIVTPKNIQLSAGKTVTVTAGKNVDMTIFQRFTVASGEAISLFAQKMGMKIYAACGKVDIQSQTDMMQLRSEKSMQINSVSEDIVLNAAQGVTLTSGGAYIKIKDGAIEIGAPGKIELKSEDIKWGGGAALERALEPATIREPEFHNAMNGRFQVMDKEDGEPKPYISYRIETEDGKIIRGVTDKEGYTQGHYGMDPSAIKFFFE
ncbi:type VI secretion system Vgr family protein [Erwinia sorbitola]|uniref:Type VI secretion system tip protein VgrG n=1 Tax=Erwinia sorbitola TaxID=2681984 RepID=A0A6I6EKS4_9GAMM|nr:type VI secretion system tip protein VgrG [Erwinia sorbitola]QGU89188.1 type VI secretion system tip protein VgrG [Erwinia sorbitola]